LGRAWFHADPQAENMRYGGIPPASRCASANSFTFLIVAPAFAFWGNNCRTNLERRSSLVRSRLRFALSLGPLQGIPSSSLYDRADSQFLFIARAAPELEAGNGRTDGLPLFPVNLSQCRRNRSFTTSIVAAEFGRRSPNSDLVAQSPSGLHGLPDGNKGWVMVYATDNEPGDAASIRASASWPRERMC